MKAKSGIRFGIAALFSIAMAILFVPVLGQVDKACAKEVSSIEIKSTQDFQIAPEDAEQVYFYLESREYENGEGDRLIVSFDDGSSDEYFCTDYAWSFETADGEKSLMLAVDDWKNKPAQFEEGESYLVDVFVYSASGDTGITVDPRNPPYTEPISVTIAGRVISNLELVLNTPIELEDTEAGKWDDNDIECHENDELTVYYSDGSDNLFIADEDGFFWDDNNDPIYLHFLWKDAESLENDPPLDFDAGEVEAYPWMHTGNDSGNPVFATDDEGKRVTIPVTIAGHDWNEPEYKWADDCSTCTATVTCKNYASHKRTQTVTTTSKVTKNPTFTEKGETTYTAAFTEAPFVEKTNTVADIPKLHDYVVTGGTEGEDYTYVDEVLTFKKNGTYKISMAEGLEVADDQIFLETRPTVNPGFNNIELTFDNLNIDTKDKKAIVGNYGNRTSNFNWKLVLKGKNTIKSNGFTWQTNIFALNLTVEAESKTTDDSIEVIYGDSNPNGNAFSTDNFTLNSGTFSHKGKSYSFDANKTIQIVDGEFYASSTSNTGTLYCNHQYVQNGGKVTIDAAGNSPCCIQVVGTADAEGDGVLINGGDLTLTSVGTTNTGTITAGHAKKKNIVINTPGTVTINTGFVGLLAKNGGSITMRQGTLKVNGGMAGIYTVGGTNPVTFSGGETELANNTYGFYLAGSDKTIHFDENYIHKNYTGTDADHRDAVADNKIIIGTVSSGAIAVSKKYVLITPAYPITYELDEGTLEEGKTNPETYTKVDNFSLNNPSKEGYDFIGWTGTDLDVPVKDVTISKMIGARYYKANFEKQTFTVKFEANGGTAAAPQTVEYGARVDESAAKTTRDDYTFDNWYTDEGLTQAYDFSQPVKSGFTLYAGWKENQVTIKYIAGKGGKVEPEAETLGVLSGKAKGAKAEPEDGYTFICWTNSKSETVSEDPAFVPKKTGGKNVAEEYVANFRKVPGPGPEPDPKTAHIVPAPELTYNGADQTAYAETEGYTVQGGSAIRAGKHTAVLTLKPGYVWPDGSKEPKEITYEVGKAVLTAAYVSETIEWYEQPALQVNVTGFVGSDTAQTASGYNTPIVKSKDWAPHTTYELTPVDGTADDYTFVYEKGTLTVNCKDVMVLKATDGKSKINLKWTAVRNVEKYEIYGGKCSTTSKAKPIRILDANVTKLTIKKLKKNNYKFYVKAIRVENGQKITIAKSETTHTMVNKKVKNQQNASKVKVKKSSITLSVGKSTKIKAKLVGKSKSKKIFGATHTQMIRYISSDQHIAKVNKRGKVRALRSGECKIYVLAPNGIWKVVKVTVK